MRDRSKHRPPSYYKKYTYPKRRYMALVLTTEDKVVARVYTDIDKGKVRYNARMRSDCVEVISVTEIPEDKYWEFLLKNPDHKNTTSRKLFSLPKPTNHNETTNQQ